jgi:hypothetical protein
MTESEIIRCSFCNASEFEANKIVVGPNVWICDACIEICYELTHPFYEKPIEVDINKHVSNQTRISDISEHLVRLIKSTHDPQIDLSDLSVKEIVKLLSS